MATKFMLMVLPTLVAASIRLDIHGADPNNSSNMTVKISGRGMDLISDMMVDTYLLKEEYLKQAVQALTGALPTDIYLRGPTPFGDLYQTYNWQQVLQTVEPRNVRILSSNEEQTTIKSRIIENNEDKPTSMDVSISEILTNSISSWSEDKMPIDEISYKVNIDSMQMPMLYKSNWNVKNSTEYEMLVAPKIVRLLEPKQGVISELTATKMTVKMEITYRASLHGFVAAHFDDAFKGKHFWTFAVEKVMRAANLNNYLMGKQIVEMTLYANPKITVLDKDTRSPVKF